MCKRLIPELKGWLESPDHFGSHDHRSLYMAMSVFTSTLPPLAGNIVAVRCSFFDRMLHLRMPLDPTHVRLTRLHACVQPMRFLSGVHCSYRCHHKFRLNAEGGSAGYIARAG